VNLPRHFRGMSTCLVLHCFVSALHLPTLHLSPPNPSFFVALLLASGSRSFFSSSHVYYGRRRHRRFCSASHVPCINILLFTCHTPHQASIRTHPSAIHTYLYSLLSRAYLAVLCLSHHLGFFNAGKDDVLHRLVSVSTFVGSPGWTLRSPSTLVFPSAFPFSLPFWFIYSRCDLVRPYSYQLSRLLHLLYNVYLFLDVRYALYSSTHSHPHPHPHPPPFSIVSSVHRHY
jgi:hypothetical protein